jgi:hypothetical protein
VAFVSDASNLVAGDTNGQPDAFVANLDSGAISRVSVSSSGAQADGPSFDVSVDGTCSRVAFSAQAPALGGGATRTVYVRSLSGAGSGTTVAASTQPNASHPSYTSRVNAATDKVAYATPGAVWVRDFVRNKTQRISGGGASAPVISEQGTVVAYARGGRIYTNDRGRTTSISQRKAGTASQPSLGGGGQYVAYAASRGKVLLYTAVRQVTLDMAVSAHGGPLVPATEPSVSTRANEVFFVHNSQIYARYLGGR